MSSRPVVVLHSAKDLDAELQAIDKLFLKKEAEDNWELREKKWRWLQSIIRSNKHEEFSEVFMASLKMLIDHLITSMHSLRTQICLAALNLVGDMSIHLNTTLDPFLEVLLHNLLKACNSSKKLVSQAADSSTTSLLSNTSYHSKTLTRLVQATAEKNNELRRMVAEYIKLILQIHGKSRQDVIERTGGVESVESWLLKGFGDASPSTRETCRATFVIFWEIWSNRARKMLNNLDGSTKKQLIRQLGDLYSSAPSAQSKSNLADSQSKSSSTSTSTVKTLKAPSKKVGSLSKPAQKAVVSPTKQIVDRQNKENPNSAAYSEAAENFNGRNDYSNPPPANASDSQNGSNQHQKSALNNTSKFSYDRRPTEITSVKVKKSASMDSNSEERVQPKARPSSRQNSSRPSSQLSTSRPQQSNTALLIKRPPSRQTIPEVGNGNASTFPRPSSRQSTIPSARASGTIKASKPPNYTVPSKIRNISHPIPDFSDGRQTSTSPPPKRKIGRAMSPGNSSTRSVSPTGSATSVLSNGKGKRAYSGSGRQTPSSMKRLTIHEMLRSKDFRNRLDGLYELLSLITSQEEVYYQDLVEAGTLPNANMLAPTLLDLYTDVSIEVVKAVTQFDALQVITQIVPLDTIIIRILAMDYGDGDEANSAVIPSLRFMKTHIPDNFVAPALCYCLTSLNSARNGGNVSMKATTKKKVINGVLRYMREISERALGAAQEDDNSYSEALNYFSEPSNMKLYFTRLFPLLREYKVGEYTYNNLVDLIWNLKQLDENTYFQVFNVFDQDIAELIADAMSLAETMYEANLKQQQEEEEGAVEGEEFIDTTPCIVQYNGHIPITGYPVRAMDYVAMPVDPGLANRGGNVYYMDRYGQPVYYYQEAVETPFVANYVYPNHDPALVNNAVGVEENRVSENSIAFGTQQDAQQGNDIFDESMTFSHMHSGFTDMTIESQEEPPKSAPKSRKTQGDFLSVPEFHGNYQYAIDETVDETPRPYNVTNETTPVNTPDANANVSANTNVNVSKPEKNQEVLDKAKEAHTLFEKLERDEVDITMLRKLIRICKMSDPNQDPDQAGSVWGDGAYHFHSFIVHLLNFIGKTSDMSLKEHAILLVRQFILTQTSYSELHAQRILLELGAARQSTSIEVVAAASSAMEAYSNKLDRNVCLWAMLEYLQGETSNDRMDETSDDYSSIYGNQTSPISAVLMDLSSVIKRFDSESLNTPESEQIVAVSNKALNNIMPEVRKSALETLVSLFKVIGSVKFSPYLQSLSVQQRKLLQAYVDRKR